MSKAHPRLAELADWREHLRHGVVKHLTFVSFPLLLRHVGRPVVLIRLRDVPDARVRPLLVPFLHPQVAAGHVHGFERSAAVTISRCAPRFDLSSDF